MNEQAAFEAKRREWRCPYRLEVRYDPHVRLGSDVIETKTRYLRCVHKWGWHEDHPGEPHITAGGHQFPWGPPPFPWSVPR